MRKRATVRAVWDSDLDSLLKSLGLLDSLLAGGGRCAKCQRAVGLENLGALFFEGAQWHVTCDDTPCVRSATAAEAAPTNG